MRFIGFCSLLLLAYCNRQYSSKSALKFNSEDRKSGIELLSDVDINENNEKLKKVKKKKLKLEHKKLTYAEYKNLDTKDKQKVRYWHFPREEWRLVPRPEKDKILLNGANASSKAFCYFEMKKKDVDKIYSITLLPFEILFFILSATNIKKFTYFVSADCPGQKFKKEYSCLTKCNYNCDFISEKPGKQIYDVFACIGLGIIILLTLVYVYSSFDPYFIRTRKFLKKISNNDDEEQFVELTEEIDISDINIK